MCVSVNRAAGPSGLNRFAADQSGSTVVVFAVGLLAISGVIGLSMVAADGYRARTETLSALDTAVLAGASAPTGTTDAERIAIAERLYTANQKLSPSPNPEVRVERLASATFGTTQTTVFGATTIERASPFLGLFDRTSMPVAVNSAATKARNAPVCVLGLDPTEDATMDFNGKAVLDIANCAAMTNSSNGTGMNQVGQPSMKALEIGVTGGYTGDAYEPMPLTGVPPISDPYASLPEPPIGACHPKSGEKVTNESVILDPGTYCGGISLQAGSIVTLNPGVYVMKDGPLSIQAGATVSGREVMIAFLGPDATLYLIGNSSLSVTSPTSGTYANIQFFGDRNVYGASHGVWGNHLWFTVVGNSRLTYDGVVYTPSFHAWFAGGSIVTGRSPNYVAIAKKLWFQDNTRVEFRQENSRGLNVEASVGIEHGARLIK